ncbi:MAG: EscU/YscU/HrcU family type III secretion system export apparatus switch protein, partial [Armatimonadota bacterium]|nr:EscU/YscU/HrcU family type III secretion system export apparatus switch protein [Armatimonadota bacterium]
MALQDRTEPATPRRREEARQEGKVAKSMDVNSVIVLLAGMLILKVAGPYMLKGLMIITTDAFSHLHSREVSVSNIGALLMSYGLRGALLCVPLAIGVGAVGVASNVMQVGLKITPKVLNPDLNRLNLVQGVARLFSWRSGVEVLKLAAKVSIVAWIIYAFLKNQYPILINLASMSPIGGCMLIANLCFQLLVRAWIAMLAIAIFDFIYQRFQFEQSMKMTKQEVKDEYRRSEGDPHVKARIRQRQREIARGRMFLDVARADVVITNPVHLAVALRYDSAEMAAPTVVAKG